MPADPGRPPDDSTYEALVEAHHQRVLRLCRLLLRDPHEAEEVTQEAFLELHRHHGDGVVADWGSWLTRVAVNRVRDRHRAGWWPRWRWRTRSLDSMPPAARAPLPDRVAIGEQTLRRIRAAFDRLPRRQREVLTLRQIEGLSTLETATLLGISENTVKQHLFRAIEALRRALRHGERDPADPVST